MKTKLRGSLFRCGRCGKSYSNPLGHECVSRMDRRQGKRRTAKAAKGAAKQQQQHRYENCRDKDCYRLPCRAWHEGHRDGHRDGYRDGYEDGFPDGVMSCPREHK